MFPCWSSLPWKSCSTSSSLSLSPKDVKMWRSSAELMSPLPSLSNTWWVEADALWLRTALSRDVRIGPHARPFTRSLAALTLSLAPLTHLLAPPYALCSCAPLHSFFGLLARSLPSLWESEWWMFQKQAVLNHCGMGRRMVWRWVIGGVKVGEWEEHPDGRRSGVLGIKRGMVVSARGEGGGSGTDQRKIDWLLHS